MSDEFQLQPDNFSKSNFQDILKASYLPQKQVFMEQSIEDSFLIDEFDNREVDFNISNALMSSSILDTSGLDSSFIRNLTK